MVQKDRALCCRHPLHGLATLQPPPESKHEPVLGAAALQASADIACSISFLRETVPRLTHTSICCLLLCAPEDVACLKSAAVSRAE